jgi:hypothetical protein
MIRVIVRQQYGVNILISPAMFFYRALGSLSAVNKQEPSVRPRHKGCQVSVWQGHHAARAQQANVKHRLLSSFAVLRRQKRAPPAAEPANRARSLIRGSGFSRVINRRINIIYG